MASNSGIASSKASASPPTMKVSSSASAPPTPPETGASTFEAGARRRRRPVQRLGRDGVDRAAVDEQPRVVEPPSRCQWEQAPASL